MARQGAARVFFDVVGIFQAEKFLTGTKTSFLAWKNITNAIMLDSMTGISEAATQFGDVFRTLIDDTVPLAESFAMSRIEFNKFARSIEDADLESMGNQVREIGEGFAFTADQSYQAAGRMSQLAGMLESQEAILAATKGAIQFGFVGGMESETAAKRMIQLQAQTGFMFGKLTEEQYKNATATQQAQIVNENLAKTISGLNTIENRSAATMAQLTFVMNQFASSAKLAGDSIEDMAAMSAVLIESGEEQGKAGRALRMIYARLGSDMSGNNAILEQYIGSVKDSSGNILSLTEIMDKLSLSWATLESNEKLSLAQSIAGNDHYVRFLKLMDGYNRKVELAAQATAGLDSVSEEMDLFTGEAAFQLKILNAEIDNTKELLGQKLLPVTIAMKQAELDLLEGANLLAEAFGHIADNDRVAMFITVSKRLTDIGKAGFETYLNIRNLNVAMQTQLLIMRAINGEKFINIHGNKANYETSLATVHLQEARLDLEARMAVLQSTKNDRVKLEADFSQRLKNATEVRVEAEKHLNDLMMDGSLLRNHIVEMVTGELGTLTGLRQAEQDRLNIMHKSAEAAERRLAATTAMGQTQIRLTNDEYKLMMERMRSDSNALGMLEKTNQQIHVQSVLHNDIYNTRLDEIGLLQQSIDGRTKEGKLLKQEYDMLIEMRNVAHQYATQKQPDTERVAALGERIKAVTKLLEVETRLRAEEKGLILTEDELTFAMNELAIAMDVEAMAAQHNQDANELLNETMANQITLGSELEGVIVRIKRARAGDTDALDQQINEDKQAKVKKFGEEYDAFGQKVMAAGAGAAIAAGMFSLLGDKIGLSKEESAAAAITAMSLAMIPAQLHMFYMTAQMMVTEGAAVSLNAAMASLAKTTLLFAGVIGVISYGVAKLASAKSETEQYAEEQERLNAALSNFNTILEEGALTNLAGSDTRSLSKLGVDLQAITDEYNTFMDSFDEATPAQQSMMTSRKNELEQLLAETTGLYDIRAAQKFAGMSEADFKQNVAAYKEINDLIYMNNQQIPAGGGGRGMGGPSGDNEEGLAKYNASLAERNRLNNIFMAENVDFIAWMNKYGITDFNMYTELMAAGLNAATIAADDLGDSISNNIGMSIDDATQSLDAFSNSAEEFFYGGSASFATGDLLKQIVTKGAENLIQNTELLMTNNFYGLTLPQMVEAVADGVTDELVSRGVVPR